MHLPSKDEYPTATYFAEYLQFDEKSDLFEIFKEHTIFVNATLESLTDSEANFSYQKNKWSLKQVFGHMVDTERIFSYRLLCFSRHEELILPGFNENEYQVNAGYDQQDIASILKQYNSTREATIDLLNSLSTKQWNQMGNANGHTVSVRSLAWMIAGHEKHHIQIIKERYVSQNP